MRISDWSSDLFSSDLSAVDFARHIHAVAFNFDLAGERALRTTKQCGEHLAGLVAVVIDRLLAQDHQAGRFFLNHLGEQLGNTQRFRSEEHTTEIQSLMRNTYAVFCLKKNKIKTQTNQDTYTK